MATDDDTTTIDDPGELLAAQAEHARDSIARHIESRRGALSGSGAVWGRDATTGERRPLNDEARAEHEAATQARETASAAKLEAKAAIIKANTDAGKPWWRGLPADVLDAEELAEIPADVRDVKLRDSRRAL